MRGGARRRRPAKRLRAWRLEFAAWHRRPGARLAAPIVAMHRWCLREKGTLANCPRRCRGEAQSRLPALRRPIRAGEAALAVAHVWLPFSQRLAPSQGKRPNLREETRCPRHCRKLPARARLEIAGALCAGAESRRRGRVPCGEVARFPGGGSPWSPTYFSGRSASTGSGSRGN